MTGEIIFYNGFNLLVDIIVGTVVFLLTRRYFRTNSFIEGFDKALDNIDKGVLFKQECEGKMKWTFDFDNCQCDGCTPTPDNVTRLFSTVEAD